MAISTVPLARKSPLLSRFAAFSPRRPDSPYLNPTRITSIPSPARLLRSLSSSSSSCRFLTKPHSSIGVFASGDLGRRGIALGQVGPARFRVSAAHGGGSGGSGGSGDGNSGGGGGGEAGGENDWSLLAWYLGLLAKYPVATKAVTSAFLTLIGDLICQIVIDQVPSLDLKRTFMFTLLGLVLVGPTLHFWYLYLSKLVTLQGGTGAFLRLLLDQFLFSPIFIGVFLSTLVTLEGRPTQVLPKLQQEWFSAVVANWQLWIPFQFLNFRFVPQQFQVLAANFIAVIWNVILSFKAHKEILPKKV